MSTRLYETRAEAEQALRVKMDNIRDDWEVEISDPVKRSPGWIDPYYRPQAIDDGTKVMVVYLYARGEFARGWDSDKGNTSRTWGFAWVESDIMDVLRGD